VLVTASRDHELSFILASATNGVYKKGRFGATPKPARETRALPGKIAFGAALFQLFAQAASELRLSEFAVELGDETGADLCGTHRFALIGVSAIAESLSVHYLHHF
jgi:hypothetical protein